MKDEGAATDWMDRLAQATRRARSEFDPCWELLLADAAGRDRFQAFMVEIFHYVRFTCPLLARFEAEIRPSHPGLADYAAHHREEEAGHDDWMLDDLERLGFSREAVRASRPLKETRALVGSQYYLMEAGEPLSHLGYIYALESNPPQRIDALADRLDLPGEALSTFRAHGELDVGHGAELGEVIAAHVRAPADWQRIIENARHSIEFLSEIVLALTVEPADGLAHRLRALEREA